jgi:glycine betaine/proline transport system substrate-binding protein
MDRGAMHVHPEVWLPNQGNLYQKYVVENGTVVKNENSIEAKQGVCITKEMSEKYDFKSIYDLTDPDKAALMDTDGDGMGEMWPGQPGAASTSVEVIRARDYGYDQTLELVETDTPINWAALDVAVKAGKPYVFSCYTPHYIFALYDIVFLEEPPHNPETWNVIQPTDDPDWLEKSTADSGWPIAYVQLHYAKSLEIEQPEAALILKNFKVSADILSAWSYSIVVDKKDPTTVAEEWVANNSDIVDSWLGL